MRDDIKLVISAGLFMTLVFSVVTVNLRAPEGTSPLQTSFPTWNQAPTGGEDAPAVARFIFGPYALPAILLSVVLLVALVAALVLAKPETGPGEDIP